MARAGSTVGVRRFQALTLDVVVRSDAPAALQAIEFLVQRARQPVAAVDRLEFTVEHHRGEYAVTVDGAVVDRAPSPAAVLDTVFAHVQSRMLRRFPDHALARGAVLRDGPARVLLVGEPRCGLTSLAVRLLHGGAVVEGDQFALLGADGLTPLPRRLKLSDDAGALLPELAAVLSRLPAVTSSSGAILGYDPAAFGFEWEIRTGGIDACVVVEPNHGGGSRLVAIGETETVRRVVARCSPPATGGGRWLADVVKLVGGTRCWRLQLGRLEPVVTMLREAWEAPGA